MPPGSGPGGRRRDGVALFRIGRALFQHADARNVCQFFQVLSDHVSVHGVTAHSHADPVAIGERDLDRLELHFDAAVDVSASGEVTVRTRDVRPG